MCGGVCGVCVCGWVCVWFVGVCGVCVCVACGWVCVSQEIVFHQL